MSLPFELRKYHKTFSKLNWKNRGIIFAERFNEIYDRYIYSSHCDKCNKKFKKSLDRCLDHDHLITDNFNIRAVLCRNCNTKNNQKWNTNTGQKHIYKVKSKKYTQGFCFRIQIKRNGKYVINTQRTTLELAVELRNKFVADNPQYDIIL
tara:strand:+ start:53 stop:502 length:450 start_codon:yes stop_codon:yes gene_type:complete